MASPLENAIRVAEQAVAYTEQEGKPCRSICRDQDGRKVTEDFPCNDRSIELPECSYLGFKLIGYDEVVTFDWGRPELNVRLNKYAKYAVPTDSSGGYGNEMAGTVSSERDIGLVKDDRVELDRHRSYGPEMLLSSAALPSAKFVRGDWLDAKASLNVEY